MTYKPTTDDMQTAAGLADWSTDEWREWYYTMRAEVRAQALKEAADDYRSGQISGVFASRDEYTKAWLRARAEQTKEDR